MVESKNFYLFIPIKVWKPLIRIYGVKKLYVQSFPYITLSVYHFCISVSMYVYYKNRLDFMVHLYKLNKKQVKYNFFASRAVTFLLQF